MNRHLARIRDLAPPGSLEEIQRLAEGLSGHTLLHVLTPTIRGPLHEMATALTPYLEELGVQTQAAEFATRDGTPGGVEELQRGLEGHRIRFTPAQMADYLLGLREARRGYYLSARTVMIHDALLAPLISERKEGQSWIWRCHAAPFRPDRSSLGFLMPYLSRFNAAVFSYGRPAPPSLVASYVIRPSLDPLSARFRPLGIYRRSRILERLEIDPGQPLALWIVSGAETSPAKVAEATARLAAQTRCHVLVARFFLAPDPAEIVAWRYRNQRVESRGVSLAPVLYEDRDTVNALLEGAEVVVARTAWPGLEVPLLGALWKSRPVVMGSSSADTLLIRNGATGLKSRSDAEAGRLAARLLREPGLARSIGARAREHVRSQFLITRHVRDYLDLLRRLQRP